MVDRGKRGLFHGIPSTWGWGRGDERALRQMGGPITRSHHRGWRRSSPRCGRQRSWEDTRRAKLKRAKTRQDHERIQISRMKQGGGGIATASHLSLLLQALQRVPNPRPSETVHVHPAHTSLPVSIIGARSEHEPSPQTETPTPAHPAM